MTLSVSREYVKMDHIFEHVHLNVDVKGMSTHSFVIVIGLR